MVGLFISTLWNYRRNKLHRKIVLESTLTCPHCGFQKMEIMPTDACVYFYDCENCKQVLKPNKGDCCVYCSFGSLACPPIQAGENCC
ncbi:MAG: GDCCVxC domain-containing (seleno)protein [Bacteroidota bacterium]